MASWIRKVPTASGATAVQIIHKDGRIVVGIDHIGSANSDDELALLLVIANEKLHSGQQSLFNEFESTSGSIKLISTFSKYLLDQLEQYYDAIGFNAIGDQIFKDVVLARLVEPVSKVDTVRVLNELGVNAPTVDTIYRSLRRCNKNNFRNIIQKACFNYAKIDHASLLLYDVTTLYFEIQKQDDFRKPGYSKERRLEPQILVGLLVDQSGFPVTVHLFEGNKSETLTILPVLRDFKTINNLKEITVVADAAMLSKDNLVKLYEAGFNFIVGSRIKKVPYGFDKDSVLIKDGFIADGATVVEYQNFLGHDKNLCKVIYQYKEDRARLDLKNIEKQIEKAKQIVEGKSPTSKVRFLKITDSKKSINEQLIDQNKQKAGIKGYVTNLDKLTPNEIISHYHKLFEVERSFRMSKSDLRARPIFHHKKESIEAHLTVVFAALAIAREVQKNTGLSIKNYIQKLKPLRTGVLELDGHKISIPPDIPVEIKALERGH